MLSQIRANPDFKRRPNTESGFFGVTKRGDKWEVRIRLLGRQRTVGLLTDQIKAAELYDYALAFFRKNFVNKPTSWKFNCGHKDEYATEPEYIEACQRLKESLEASIGGPLPEYADEAPRLSAARSEIEAARAERRNGNAQLDALAERLSARFDAQDRRLDSLAAALSSLQAHLTSFEAACRHSLQAIADKLFAAAP